MKVHHIGYLVQNVEAASKQFAMLGFTELSKVIYDPYRGTDILFMENDGGYRIELIAPKHEKSEMWKQLKKRGAMPYHICYIAEDIEKEIAGILENGHGEYKLLSQPEKAPAINEKRVAFLYGEDIGLMELVEG